MLRNKKRNAIICTIMIVIIFFICIKLFSVGRDELDYYKEIIDDHHNLIKKEMKSVNTSIQFHASQIAEIFDLHLKYIEEINSLKGELEKVNNLKAEIESLKQQRETENLDNYK